MSDVNGYLGFWSTLREVRIPILIENLRKGKGIHFSNNHTEDNIVLHDKKAVYFFIPKVGCTSIKEILRIHLSLNSEKVRFQNTAFPTEFSVHAVDFPYIRQSQLKKYDDYFFFAFVRNPYDRVVSCYKNRITDDAHNNIYPYINGVDRELAKTGNFFSGMSFIEFCREISTIPDNRADRHFRSQHITLCDTNGSLMMDYIGRFETFERDVRHVMRQLGIEGDIPHLMQSHKGDYHDYYDDEAQGLIAKRYHRDIELFGYSF